MTQNSRILNKLLAHPEVGITSLEAAQMSPPIMRLSERIRELEADGALFSRSVEKTADGKGSYTRYFLESLESYRPKMSFEHPYTDAIHDAQMAIL
jgi:stalled ribosome alternative rescue factor ArfA